MAQEQQKKKNNEKEKKKTKDGESFALETTNIYSFLV